MTLGSLVLGGLIPGRHLAQLQGGVTFRPRRSQNYAACLGNWGNWGQTGNWKLGTDGTFPNFLVTQKPFPALITVQPSISTIPYKILNILITSSYPFTCSLALSPVRKSRPVRDRS